MQRPKSLVVGKDSQVLETLLSLHARPNPRILDTTYGRGVMWKGIEDRWRPIRMDLNPAKGIDVVGDFLDLGHVRRGSGECTPCLADSGGVHTCSPVQPDVIVWDPPHITDAGKRSQLNGGTRGGDRYGLDGLHGHDISCLYGPFLHGAATILADDGVILVKLSDQVHAQRHQWQQVDFINAVRATPGLTACDMVIKGDPRAGTLMGLWKRVLHVRNAHAFWIVVRKGDKCHASNAFRT